MALATQQLSDAQLAPGSRGVQSMLPSAVQVQVLHGSVCATGSPGTQSVGGVVVDEEQPMIAIHRVRKVRQRIFIKSSFGGPRRFSRIRDKAKVSSPRCISHCEVALQAR